MDSGWQLLIFLAFINFFLEEFYFKSLERWLIIQNRFSRISLTRTLNVLKGTPDKIFGGWDTGNLVSYGHMNNGKMISNLLCRSTHVNNIKAQNSEHRTRVKILTKKHLRRRKEILFWAFICERSRRSGIRFRLEKVEEDAEESGEPNTHWEKNERRRAFK